MPLPLLFGAAEQRSNQTFLSVSSPSELISISSLPSERLTPLNQSTVVAQGDQNPRLVSQQRGNVHALLLGTQQHCEKVDYADWQ
jgi:hypothetical protein